MRYTPEEFQKKLQRWAKKAPKEIKDAMDRAGLIVQREVQEKHLSGPKMARGVGSMTRATLGTASKQWFLRRSINVRSRLSGSRVSLKIGTNVGYGRKHEEGLEGMPKRPFLAPSIKKKKNEVMEEIAKGFMKAYKKA